MAGPETPSPQPPPPSPKPVDRPAEKPIERPAAEPGRKETLPPAILAALEKMDGDAVAEIFVKAGDEVVGEARTKLRTVETPPRKTE